MYRFKFLMLVCVTVCASYLYAEILGVGDITETEALEEFYTKTEGDGWTNRDNWLEGDPCLNQWYGVTCNADGNITALHLSSNKLDGYIPKEIGRLTELTELTLDNNRLDEELTSKIGLLTKLTKLNLHNNNIDGRVPNEIKYLTELKELWLSDNIFDGELPSNLRKLLKLKSLYLQNNKFINTIPDDLKELINLEVLSLSGNYFSGVIPEEIGELVSLKLLDLSHNELSGEIPVTMLNLTNLADCRGLKIDIDESNGLSTQDSDLRVFINLKAHNYGGYPSISTSKCSLNLVPVTSYLLD